VVGTLVGETVGLTTGCSVGANVVGGTGGSPVISKHGLQLTR
jgi:hypothetical protein